MQSPHPHLCLLLNPRLARAVVAQGEIQVDLEVVGPKAQAPSLHRLFRSLQSMQSPHPHLCLLLNPRLARAVVAQGEIQVDLEVVGPKA